MPPLLCIPSLSVAGNISAGGHHSSCCIMPATLRVPHRAQVPRAAADLHPRRSSPENSLALLKPKTQHHGALLRAAFKAPSSAWGSACPSHPTRSPSSLHRQILTVPPQPTTTWPRWHLLPLSLPNSPVLHQKQLPGLGQPFLPKIFSLSHRSHGHSSPDFLPLKPPGFLQPSPPLQLGEHHHSASQMSPICTHHPASWGWTSRAVAG